MSSLPSASTSSSSSSFSVHAPERRVVLPLAFPYPATVGGPLRRPTAAVRGFLLPAPRSGTDPWGLPSPAVSAGKRRSIDKDVQIITPEAIESVKASHASSEIEQQTEAKKKAIPRKAAGQAWEDLTLTEWPENDYRVFCGDLGNEVIRDKRTGKTKAYGFVSFGNPSDLAAELKQMNGKYVGNPPIKLRKSNWKERTDYEAIERQRNHTRKKAKLQKNNISQVKTSLGFLHRRWP